MRATEDINRKLLQTLRLEEAMLSKCLLLLQIQCGPYQNPKEVLQDRGGEKAKEFTWKEKEP